MGKYHCTIDLLFDWFEISCMTTDNFCFYLQNRRIETSQTGGQQYSDNSPFSIPWTETNIQAYFCTPMITSVKSFIVLALGPQKNSVVQERLGFVTVCHFNPSLKLAGKTYNLLE
jgi:hypothetical protein